MACNGATSYDLLGHSGPEWKVQIARHFDDSRRCPLRVPLIYVASGISVWRTQKFVHAANFGAGARRRLASTLKPGRMSRLAFHQQSAIYATPRGVSISNRTSRLSGWIASRSGTVTTSPGW